MAVRRQFHAGLSPPLRAGADDAATIHSLGSTRSNSTPPRSIPPVRIHSLNAIEVYNHPIRHLARTR